MGLDLTIKAARGEFALRLSQVDTDILGIVTSKHPEAVEAVFGVRDFGEPVHIRREEMLKAISTVGGALENDSDLLPYVYAIRYELGPGVWIDGPGTASGFRLYGDEYLSRSRPE